MDSSISDHRSFFSAHQYYQYSVVVLPCHFHSKHPIFCLPSSHVRALKHSLAGREQTFRVSNILSGIVGNKHLTTDKTIMRSKRKERKDIVLSMGSYTTLASSERRSNETQDGTKSSIAELDIETVIVYHSYENPRPMG